VRRVRGGCFTNKYNQRLMPLQRNDIEVDAGIWRCCGGRGSIIVRGTRGRVRRPLGGHLEVLKWAVTNGCPWNAERVRTGR